MNEVAGVSLDAICANLDDHLLKLAYADWLEEQGHMVEAEAWRYLGEHRKNPQYEKEYGRSQRRQWFWWSFRLHTPNSYTPLSCMLPPDWHECLDASGFDNPDNQTIRLGSRHWATSYDCFKYAITAYEKLTSEQRKACWEWKL